jgi:hypothetical protein
MSAELQSRAQAWVKHQARKVARYTEMTDWFIVSYAGNGRIEFDADYRQLLALCLKDARKGSKRGSGEETVFLRETAEILEAIQLEA